jgi:DNA-binding NarL/FixJ family response regulator
MNKVTFIIAEKSYIIRNGLINIINGFPETAVIKEVSDLQLLSETVNKYKPDIVIINSGLLKGKYESIHGIFQRPKHVKYVILKENEPEHSEMDYFDEMILINEPKDKIIQKIQNLISSKLPEKHKFENNELTVREKDVIRLVALGKTNKEIADLLFISTHTAITHRKNITGKLGIKTVSGLTVYAILNNIISIEEGV